MGVASLAGVTAFALAFVLTPGVRRLALARGWVSRPVADRWGHRIVARAGGIVMFAGFLGATLLWVPSTPRVASLWLGTTLVFALGLWDDLARMRPYTKLLLQLLIGCVMVMRGVRIELFGWPWLSIPVSILWFAVIINAFNLLDNMDGLAAGVGAIAAGFCVYHAGLREQWTIVSLSAALCGSCLGFLSFNFPPARIFMGDSGSHFLGLTLATLALPGEPTHQRGQLVTVLAVPVLILAVPIFDTCFVAIQRVAHGQHPFKGGKDHVSHRLAILGLSTRQTVLALYATSAALGLLSILSASLESFSSVPFWLMALTVLLLLGLYLAQVKVYRADALPDGPQASDPVMTPLGTMLLHKRRLVELIVDFLMISCVYVLAHMLRFEGQLNPDVHALIVQSLPLVLALKLACFAGFGLYRGVWRYVGLADLVTVFKAVTLGSVLSTALLVYAWRFEGYSRSVLIIDWMLTFLAVAGSRVVGRLLDEWISAAAVQGTPTLIIGAGDTGELVLRCVRHEEHLGLSVVGFLDADPRKHGNRIHGCPVLGGPFELVETVERHRVRKVLIAINDPPGALLQLVQQCCEPRRIAWKVVTAGITDVV